MHDERDVRICCIPRTGSTFVYNLVEACGITIKERKHKAHLGSHCVIIETRRHPLDMLASHIRLRQVDTGTGNEEALIREYAKQINEEAKDIYRLGSLHKGRHIILYYEKFFVDHDVIYNAIESITGRSVPPKERAEISRKWGVERVREHTAGIAKSDRWGLYCGGHIRKDGKPGGWKEVIPQGLWALAEELMQPTIKLWGY